jgi:8-oxo-dGTP pyrophosphatase MutT (NUDIX family)
VTVDRPGVGEALNAAGAVSVARQAATVILLRGGADALEVLLVQRNHNARFMPGAWVFPGGAVDAGEGDGDQSHRLAAVRELEEEAGVGGVPPDQLVKFSRWITPPEIAIRFDTHFFLAPLPDAAIARVDGAECVDLRWLSPSEALERRRGGELSMVFPTIKHLEQLAPFRTAEALLAHARGKDVRPVQPRVVGAGEQARIVLPGEPGYDETSTLARSDQRGSVAP